jgi:hypothetical protein
MALDNLTLEFQTLGGEIHEAIQLGVEIPFAAAADIAETGCIEGDDTNGAGLLG